MAKPSVVVVLAGGSGTRLWPLSRVAKPKQVVSLLGRKTLLEATIGRLPAGGERPYVVTTAGHAGSVRRRLPPALRRRLMVEPVPRGTAVAVALAVAAAARTSPDATVTVLSSDQVVRNLAAYRRALALARRTAERHPHEVVLVGVQPEYPETGYGYIELGRRVGGGVWRVRRFVEKPPLARAQRFVASGRYLWNPAIFTATAQRWLQLFRELLPRHYRAATRAAAAWGTASWERVAAEEYRRLPNVTIDYGLLERTRKLLVIPAPLGWADVGHWRSVHHVLATRPDAEVVRGRHVGVGGRGNLIVSTVPHRLIATVGLSDTVIVDTPDALLVCPRHEAQRVRELVARLTGRDQRYL